ncbi:MAG: LTA synthase family protein [bacterium]|nr:LTA synthase family protein [bacterium]
MLHAFKLLLTRLAIAMLFASLCRLLFLIFNPVFFQYSVADLAQGFYYGLLYDLSVTIYVHGLFLALHLLPAKLFYKKPLQQFLFFLFLFGQLLILFFNMVDIGYFPISGKRSGMEIFSMASETNGLVLQYLSDYWYLLLALLGMLWLNYKLYLPSYKQAISIGFGAKYNQLSTEVLLRIFVLAFAFVGARGGLNLLPLNTFDAARQTRAELIPLVVNTPFNMIISTQQSGLKELNYMSVQTEEKWFNPMQKIVGDSVLVSKRNLVVIVVESLGKEYVGFYNNQHGYTPFLDSLMQYSEVYMHAYANGKKSIEGIPAILASIPSWMETPYLSSYYQGNDLHGAAYYLQKLGYDASFYHGGKNGTMSFDNFIALSGGGKYFGKNEYPTKADFDGFWGISDQPYLRYFGAELGEKKEPFFSTVFTLTSHHPYELPAGEKGKFPMGTLPIHQTIGYADDALRAFFTYAKTQSWYAHTSFILTADHSAENVRPYYQSAQGKYEVPLFVFRPGYTTLKLNNRTLSHLDIMPLILQEANYADSFFSFGINPKSESKNGAAIQYQDGYYRIIQWPYVYHFDGQNTLALFNVSEDSLLKKNLMNEQILKPKLDSMDMLLKSTLQSYHRKLISNKAFLP